MRSSRDGEVRGIWSSIKQLPKKEPSIRKTQRRDTRECDSLRDLKFTGQWDRIALQSVRYYTNPDRTAYYVEVKTGWIGKPNLKMPDEFCRGTGYTTSWKPANR